MVSTPIIPLGFLAIAPEHSEILLWGSLGVVAVLFLGFALLWLRRKYHPVNMTDQTPSMSFSMQSVEKMRDDGVIDDEEFRRLRALALGLAPPDGDSENSTLSSPSDVDDGTEELDSDNEQQD